MLMAEDPICSNLWNPESKLPIRVFLPPDLLANPGSYEVLVIIIL